MMVKWSEIKESWITVDRMILSLQRVKTRSKMCPARYVVCFTCWWRLNDSTKSKVMKFFCSYVGLIVNMKMKIKIAGNKQGTRFNREHLKECPKFIKKQFSSCIIYTRWRRPVYYNNVYSKWVWERTLIYITMTSDDLNRSKYSVASCFIFNSIL